MRVAVALLAACTYSTSGPPVSCDPDSHGVTGTAAYSYDLSWHPSQALFATGAEDTVRLFDAQSLERLDDDIGPARFNTVVFTPDGRLLTATGPELRVYGVDDDRLRLLSRLDDHEADLQRLVLSSDGTRMLSCDVDGNVMLYALDDTLTLLDMRPSHTRCTRVAFSPDGTLGSSAGHDGRLPLYDLRDDRIVLLDYLDFEVDEIGEVRFVTNDTLYVGSFSLPYALWQVSIYDHFMYVVDVVTGHQSGLSSLDLSPDGQRLLTADHDHTVHLYDVEANGRLTHRFDLPDKGIGTHTARFAPDGHTVGRTASVFDRVDVFDLRDCGL